MTKREFEKLKKGDILMVFRHLLDQDGHIMIPENSEWRVEDIEIRPAEDKIGKSEKVILIINNHTGQSLTITKNNSINFLIFKRKRGPLPRS